MHGRVELVAGHHILIGRAVRTVARFQPRSSPKRFASLAMRGMISVNFTPAEPCRWL